MLLAKNCFRIIFVLFIVFLSACGRIQTGQPPGSEISIELAMEPDQAAVGPSQLVISITDQNGRPINNASLTIEGNMTHAGMTPVFAEANGGTGGRYAVPFEWTMGGDWIVTVEVGLEDGQVLSREFPVTVK